ncbi:MAG: serine/threonine-protein phosphatase [Bacteroidia bacterium]|nr:serine/threonine-protein phosphatase [Bacteroidia bacterium]MDW8235907.1 PP2C family protein-serine/threonine phosphatase [Bacteroidia bacterium]
MKIGQLLGPLLLPLGIATFGLQLIFAYFRPDSPVIPGLGLAGLFAFWLGAFLFMLHTLSWRWRTPASLLRWNAILIPIGIANFLLWGIVILVVGEKYPRLFSLAHNAIDTVCALQAALHFAIAGHLFLIRPLPIKSSILIGFYIGSALILTLHLILPEEGSYLTPLIWIGLLPILYYSQWLAEVAAEEVPQATLLIALSLIGLFLEWEVLPDLLFTEFSDFLETIHPLLAAGIFLHGGWLLVPLLLRITQTSIGNRDPYALLTDFLARQQRATTIQSILENTISTLSRLSGVAHAYIQLKASLEDTYIASSLPEGNIREGIRQLLQNHSGTDAYIQEIPNLRNRHSAFPETTALLIQRPVARLYGPLLHQALQIAILAQDTTGFEEKDIQLILTLTEQTALFLENLERKIYHDQLVTARKEADLLRQTREALMPPPIPILDKVEVDVLFEQYDRTIGGDYYQVYAYPDEKIDFWISDNSGTGIAAAYQMAQTRGALNTLWTRGLGPEEFLLELNDALYRIFPRGHFLAATLLRFDLRKQEYTLLRAGNPEVFYWTPAMKQPEVLRPSGIALGISNASKISRIITAEKGKLVPGTTFICFSDGFSEATNSQGERLGSDRLLHIIQAHIHRPTHEISSYILEAVRQFTGSTSLGDDGTLMIVRYTGK